MKKTVLAVVAMTTVVGLATDAYAQGRAVTGAAIGAGAGLVVAGPPGAVVGGVVGAVVGGPKVHYYHHHRSYVDRDRHYYIKNGQRHYY